MTQGRNQRRLVVFKVVCSMLAGEAGDARQARVEEEKKKDAVAHDE
jgi:hypothetical protein